MAGFAIAILLSRRDFAARDFLAGVANLPLILPPTVLGYALLVGLGARTPVGRLYEALTGNSLVFTWQGAVVAACVASLPLFVSHARVAISAVDRDVLDAARVDGANWKFLLLRIVLPLARPGLIAGTVLTFARALGDFGATLMVAGDTPGRTQTMPLAIYDAVMNDDPHTVEVFVGLTVGLCLLVTILAARCGSGSEGT